MLKKLLILLCLGAFIGVATVGGCGKKPDEPPADNGDENGDENGDDNGDE